MRLRLGINVLFVLSLAAIVGAVSTGAPVADAAMRGERDTVRSLLQQGADVNAAHGDGMSALHWAAQRGDADLTAMLLYAGANTGAVTRIGQYTPLHLASRAGSVAVVEALLDGGANVGARTSPGQVTPLHLAAASGNAAVVTLLLDRGADVNAREGEWGQTPLIFAAAVNRVEVIRVLLQRGADASVTTTTLDLATHQALDRAGTQLQRKILETAVPKGQEPTPSQLQAAIQAARELYASGKIPEPEPEPAPAAAADTPSGQAGGAAPQGADPSAAAGQAQVQARDPEEGPQSITAKGGLTALLHAARQGHLEAVTALLDGGADINQQGAGESVTPLLMAIINGQFDTAMLLIERGADPNVAAAPNGVTPLWAAINTQWQPRTRFPQPQQMELQQSTYLEVTQALLEAGADVNARIKIHPWYMVYSGCGNRNCGLADTAGSTAFWRAAYAVDVEAMRLLARHGASPNIPTVAPPPPRVGRGGPPGGGANADGAARQPQGGAPGADGAGRPAPAGRGLDPSGLPPVPVGGPGAYALHAAAGLGHGEGFAGNAHRVAPDGWLPAVKYLVEELGMDVNMRDNNGYTPLHHAAARGDNEMVLYLISKGADITAVSRRGQTVADMANGPVQRVSPYPQTVDLLERLGSKNSHNCVSC